MRCRCDATERLAPRFPGGRGRTEVPVPCIVAEIDVDALVVEARLREAEGGGEDGDELVRAVGRRVDDAMCAGRGANVVCVVGGAGGQLYGAAVEARARVDAAARAEPKPLLLVGDDAGAAAAAGADGVLLSPDGLPVVVARRLLGDEGTRVVGRRCQTLDACLEAVKDGADFVVVVDDSGGDEGASNGYDATVREVRSATSVPVLIDGSSTTAARSAAAADGVVVRCASGEVDVWKRALVRSREGAGVRDAGEGQAGARVATDATTSSTNGVLDEVATPPLEAAGASASMLLIDDERALLERVLELLERATPAMDEMQLLRDGVAALDNPFLLVVVGEFNSGKSTVINAVLGSKFLECGVVPTTNEIAMLRYGACDESALDKDGRLVRSLPADLLRTVTIVDTPGTNVILDRQQRLTEEYVPRADLVVFVLSADRPLTESEIAFMKYIRQWGKKMLFVVNKIDLLESAEEVEQVQAFVRKNIDRVLGVGVGDVRVLPLCAKKALAAREAMSTSLSGGGAGGALAANSSWAESGFGDLQDFILAFLGVDIETGRTQSAMDAEAERLKLSTPLTLGAALLDSCDEALRARLGGLRAELGELELRLGSLKQYVTEVERDAAAAERKVQKTFDAAIERAHALVDRTLDVSNIPELVSTYIAGDAKRSLGPAFSGTVVGGGMDLLKDAIGRRKELAERSGAEHLDASAGYLASVRARDGVEDAIAAARGGETFSSSSSSLSSSSPSLETAVETLASTSSSASSLSAHSRVDEVIDAFRLDAAELLLEQELRDSAQYCAIAAAGAAAAGNVAGHFVQSGLEDVVALLLTVVGGYIGLLALPLRRFQTKEKIRRMAGSFKDELCVSLARESHRDIATRTAEFEGVLLPTKAMLRDECLELEALLTERESRSEDVERLLQRVESM